MSITTLIGAPLDLGGASLGVDIAPQTLRDHHIAEKLESTGLSIQDNGDIAITPRDQLQPGNPHLKYADEIIRVNEQLAQQTHDAVKAGQLATVLGGDHAVCLGAVAGASVALNGELGLIYLDAHGDMNTDKTSLTGNIHGMHLASLMGFGARELVDVFGKGAKIQTGNLVHIGGADLDEAEKQLMSQQNLHTFTMFDLLTSNLSPALQLIDDLASRVKHLWVSLDLDCIDEVYAPGAGMPNKKGLTYREIATIAERIGSTNKVVGVDVVEYNPHQDVDSKTAELSIELIATFYGKSYSWYTNYLAKNQSA